MVFRIGFICFRKQENFVFPVIYIRKVCVSSENEEKKNGNVIEKLPFSRRSFEAYTWLSHPVMDDQRLSFE